MSQMVKPYPGMIIDQDITFYPGVYDFYMQAGMMVTADNITIDANHAVFINGSKKEEIKNETALDEFGYGDRKEKVDYRGYYSIALSSKGTKNVTIKNMHAKGFLLGLKLEECENWTIENNIFSYNYHNMDWGWDDHPIRGGIHLIHCNQCRISDNVATDVWDALVLTHSNNNQVRHNNFSHTSDTGLKLWHACNNHIEDNDFSWGLRKSPGEVHARDSACVLVESGSNDNHFRRNNMTYGGDGFFIRSLNGWMSTGNVMTENDMSFANNNAIEAWSDGNTYVNNKVNHSSYGFWLGNSDNTVLIGNEVAFNGGNFHNAPECFGNSGIAVVNGSGSHYTVIDNSIHDNVGPGLAVRYNVDYPSYHWIIENNIFQNNRSKGMFDGHGIYLKNAKWLTLTNNTFIDNEGEDICLDGHVADIHYLPGGDAKRPECQLDVSSTTFIVNERYIFDASDSQVFNGKTMHVRWDFGDGTISHLEKVEKSFEQPGFYRVGLTVDDGEKANLAFANIYVTPATRGMGTTIDQWTLESDTENISMWNDFTIKVTENGAIGVKAYDGKSHQLTCRINEDDARGFQQENHLTFMLKYYSEATDWDDVNKRPIVTLYDQDNNMCKYQPDFAHLKVFNALVNEYKNNWMYFEIPLAGSKEWTCEVDEAFDRSKVATLSFEIGPHESSYCEFYLDGIKLYSIQDESYSNILLKKEGSKYPMVTVSSSHEESNNEGPLLGENPFGDQTIRYISKDGHKEVSYTIDLGTEHYMDQLEIVFYENHTNTDRAYGETLPTAYQIDGRLGDKWIKLFSSSNVITKNQVRFELQKLSQLKLHMHCEGMPIAIQSICGWNTHNTLNSHNTAIETSNTAIVDVEKLGLRLNKELNETGAKLGDLIVGMHEFGSDKHQYKTLYKTIIPEKQVATKGECIVVLPVANMQSGKEYFVTLGQTNEAESRSVGSYYRWVGDGFTNNDPTYGFIVDGTFKNDEVGWGKNWMKIYTNRMVYDYSHSNENLGNRLGLKDSPIRFQKFKLDDPVNAILLTNTDHRLGWHVGAEQLEHLTIKPTSQIDGNKLVLYFKEACDASVTIKINDSIERTFVMEKVIEWDIRVSIETLVIQIETKIDDVILNNIEWM